MSTPAPTLTGAGYALHSDAAYQSNYMTGGGRAAVSGARFVAAKVVSVTGGSSPQLQIRNGASDAAPIVRAVAATPGATIDQRGAPDLCAQGIWIGMSGNPKDFAVEVLWK